MKFLYIWTTDAGHGKSLLVAVIQSLGSAVASHFREHWLVLEAFLPLRLKRMHLASL